MQGWGAGAGLSRVFFAPWSRSQNRMKKKTGAGAGAGAACKKVRSRNC